MDLERTGFLVRELTGFLRAAKISSHMVEKYTNGRVKIEFHSAGEIVPAMQVYDAAGQGIIDFGQGCPCLAKSRGYALQWFVMLRRAEPH